MAKFIPKWRTPGRKPHDHPHHQRHTRNPINAGVVIALVILGLFIICGIFAPLVAPYNPTSINLGDALKPPAFQPGGQANYPLGTDRLGRDVLSRIIYGARVSLEVAAIGVIASGIIGMTLGVISGYKGGIVDMIIQRAVDIMLGLPMILIAMVLAIIFGASLINVAFVLIIIFWATFCRQARAETLKLRTLDFVTLARTSGTSDFIIILRHIVPNVMGSMLVLATLNVGATITLEATLSFLGAGIPPPAPSWGLMTADGRDMIVTAWWLSFMPGVAISLVVLACNVFGDWLRDRLDPKLRTI
jgi:peptide/nickel transport system permease protein